MLTHLGLYPQPPPKVSAREPVRNLSWLSRKRRPARTMPPAVEVVGSASHAYAGLTEDQVIDWCRNRQAGYKRPRSISFSSWSQMPRTATGEILSRRLPEQYTR